jgi:hypothetical protein
MVGGAAYAAAKHRRNQEEQGAQDDGYDEPQAPEAPPAPPVAAVPEPRSDADQIQRLAELHDAGTLTDDEFSAAKAKVLGI